MRVNKFVALATGISRRDADRVIADGKVLVNGQLPEQGQQVANNDLVTLGDKQITAPTETVTIMLNKPIGYVCSREGQGSRTIYELLPAEYHTLKPVGRLDKDSSGLILLTNDGVLANQLTHPRYSKQKVYEIQLQKPLEPRHRRQIQNSGIMLSDGLSKLRLEPLQKGDATRWKITMSEGRNRQIRRTFVALGYQTKQLHRTHFGPYTLDSLQQGTYRLTPVQS